MKLFFILFISFLIVINSTALNVYALEDIVIVISYIERKAPIFNIADEIINAMSKKLNKKITLIALPARRAIKHLLDNKVHADIGRIEYFKNIAKNSIMVKESIIELSLHAYSDNKQIAVDGWESLESFDIVYINGRVFKEQFLYNHKKLHYVNSISSGLNMLVTKHADVYIDYAELTDSVLKKYNELNDNKIVKLEPPLELMKFFVFFAPGYPELAREFEKAFIELKEEGTYQEIISKYLKN